MAEIDVIGSKMEQKVLKNSFEISHIFAYAVIPCQGPQYVPHLPVEKKMTIVHTAVDHFSYQNCLRSFNYTGRTLLLSRQAAPAPPWHS
jgi:hypothetical protein